MHCPDIPKLDARTLLLGLWIGLLLFTPQAGWTIGTLAGTSISNKATVQYKIGASPQSPVSSSTVSFRVDEVIQAVLTWQDSAPVAISTPGKNDLLVFLLTNSGNGTQIYGLTRVNGPTPLPNGNYTPLNGSLGSIYLENGLQAGFQASGPNADVAYVPGTNDPRVSPGASQIIYVISDAPGVPFNARGDVLLRAASLTAGAAGAMPGTSLAGLGQGGGFAVVGSTRAQANSVGSYIATGMGFVLAKSVLSVLNPGGSSVVMPGAVMTYQIMATLSGTGIATNLVLTDPLPSNTTYVPGSIAVNGIARTDEADADNVQFNTTTRTITVSLGNVAAPTNIVITFRATIN